MNASDSTEQPVIEIHIVICSRCQDNGVVLTPGQPAEWCDCEKAGYVRERAPDLVTEWNHRREHPLPLSPRPAFRLFTRHFNYCHWCRRAMECDIGRRLLAEAGEEARLLKAAMQCQNHTEDVSTSDSTQEVLKCSPK
jgi:hypothetical protein